MISPYPGGYLWKLEEQLTKADASLVEDARKTLLSRQFMKGLQPHIRLKLLESNPTPSLEDMVTYIQRFRAVHPPVEAASHLSLTAPTQQTRQLSSARPDDMLLESLGQVTAAITPLTTSHEDPQSLCGSPTTPQSFAQHEMRERLSST